MLQWFLMGGPWMHLVLFLGTLAAPIALLAPLLAAGSWWAPMLRRPAQGVVGTAAVTAAPPVLAGAGGWMSGRRLVFEAVRNASPEYREAILEFGLREAAIPLWFGLATGTVLALGAALGLVLIVLAPRPQA